jgi:DNA polymerase
MIVAQAPGYREDEEGRMFIGPSGIKLDELLENAQVQRKSIYMTNLVKCALPHNRKLKPGEITDCSQYLDQEINIVEPEVISTLGYHPAKYIFGKYGLTEKLDYSEICGVTFKADDKTIYPLRHPATLLYNPRKEAEIKENYKRLKAFLEKYPR